MRLRIILLILMSILLSGIAYGQCVTLNDSQPITITTDVTLCAGQDVQINQTAITFNTAGKTLDCNGTKIRGNKTGSINAINMNFQDNSIVKNCILMDRNTGIYDSYGDNNTYTNNSFHNCTNGIRIFNTNHNNISYNFFNGSYSNNTEDTYATRYVYYGDGITVNTNNKNLSIFGNSFNWHRNGIIIYSGMDYWIYNNSFQDIGANGYSISVTTGANHTHIYNNTLTKCGWDCMRLNGYIGEVSDNNITAYFHHGIDTLDDSYVGESSYYNITRNYIYDDILDDPTFNSTSICLYINMGHDNWLFNNSCINGKITVEGNESETFDNIVEHNYIYGAKAGAMYSHANRTLWVNNTIGNVGFWAGTRITIDVGNYDARNVYKVDWFENNTYLDDSVYVYIPTSLHNISFNENNTGTFEIVKSGTTASNWNLSYSGKKHIRVENNSVAYYTQVWSSLNTVIYTDNGLDKSALYEYDGCTLPEDKTYSTDISLCKGNYYFYTNTNTEVFLMDTDGKTLNCRGAIINGNGTGRGITGYQDRTQIKNCLINNYAEGIYFNGGLNNLIFNNTIHNPRTYGIDLQQNTRNMTIKHNTIYNDSRNVNGNGIFFTGTGGTSNITIINNSIYGFSYSLNFNPTTKHIDNKIINNTLDIGLLMNPLANYTVIKGNIFKRILGGDRNAIEFEGNYGNFTYNIIEDFGHHGVDMLAPYDVGTGNTISYNTITAVTLTNSSCIHIRDADNTNVHNNTCYTSRLTMEGNQTLSYNNIAQDNTIDNINLAMYCGGWNTIFRRNTITNPVSITGYASHYLANGINCTFENNIYPSYAHFLLVLSNESVTINESSSNYHLINFSNGGKVKWIGNNRKSFQITNNTVRMDTLGAYNALFNSSSATPQYTNTNTHQINQTPSAGQRVFAFTYPKATVVKPKAINQSITDVSYSYNDITLFWTQVGLGDTNITNISFIRGYANSFRVKKNGVGQGFFNGNDYKITSAGNWEIFASPDYTMSSGTSRLVKFIGITGGLVVVSAIAVFAVSNASLSGVFLVGILLASIIAIVIISIINGFL